MEINKYSKTITQDQTQPAAQAMFYGIGLTDADLAKAQAASGAYAGQLGLTGQRQAAQLAAEGSLLGNAAMQGTYNQLGQVATGVGNTVGGIFSQIPAIQNWLA